MQDLLMDSLPRYAEIANQLWSKYQERIEEIKRNTHSVTREISDAQGKKILIESMALLIKDMIQSLETLDELSIQVILGVIDQSLLSYNDSSLCMYVWAQCTLLFATENLKINPVSQPPATRSKIIEITALPVGNLSDV